MTVLQKLNLGRPGKPSAPSEGGNLMVMLIEIESAYHALEKEEKLLLFYRHGESMDFDEIARTMKAGSQDAVRMKHRRIIKKLIKKIGGLKPFKDNDTAQPTDVIED